MKLFQAMNKRSLSLVKANDAYKNHVLTINESMVSVLNSQLPNMPITPANYGDFARCLTYAQTDALLWVNNVLTPLLSNPKTIVNRQKNINAIFEDAIKNANHLVVDPKANFVRDILISDLELLQDQFEMISIMLETTVDSITVFKNRIPEIAKELRHIVDLSKESVGVDRNKIDKLNKEIQQLNDDIKKLSLEIAGLAITDGIAVILGSVATIAAWPFGLVSWLVLGPAIFVASTFIVLDSIEIYNDKKKIEAAQGDVNDLESSIVVLDNLAIQFEEMSNNVSLLESHAQAVLNEWLLLEQDTKDALEAIKASLNNTDNDNFQTVCEDLENAQTEWNNVYMQASLLNIDIYINDAQLEAGMSQSEIESATQNGKTVTIFEYYNRKKIS